MATKKAGDPGSYGWSAPGASEKEHVWTFIHCPVGRDLRLCVLSEKPLFWEAHWFGSTSRVCLGRGCEFCARASKPVRRFLLSVWDFDLAGKCVFEVGETTVSDMARHLGGQSSGRGLCFRIWRDGRSKRSRICATPLEGGIELVTEEWKNVDTSEIVLPSAQNLDVVLKSILQGRGGSGGEGAGGVAPAETGERHLTRYEARAEVLKNPTHSLKSGSGNGLEGH